MGDLRPLTSPGPTAPSFLHPAVTGVSPLEGREEVGIITAGAAVGAATAVVGVATAVVGADTVVVGTGGAASAGLLVAAGVVEEVGG